MSLRSRSGLNAQVDNSVGSHLSLGAESGMSDIEGDTLNSTHYSSSNEISFKTIDRAPSTEPGRAASVVSRSNSRRSQRSNGSHRSRHSTLRSNHSGNFPTLSDSAVFRLDTIETDVNIMRSDIEGVKDTMDTVTSQLAILVSATTEKPPPSSNQAPDSQQGTHVAVAPTHVNKNSHVNTPTEGQRELMPPPAALRQQANENGFIDLHIKKEEMSHPRSDGKSPFINDIFTEKLIGKPYMFLEREGVRTLKEKLDARGTMSGKEYINALIALTKYKPAFDAEDGPHIVTHLHEVSTDDMSRTWKQVLAWSQKVFDQVEKKQLFWHQYQEIQNLRFRLCYASEDSSDARPRLTSNIGHSVTSNSGQSVVVTCPEFNQAKGCYQKSHHNIGAVKLIHACAFCFGEGKQLPHTISACNNKMFKSTHTHQPSNGQPNRGAVSGANVYVPNNHQNPKN